MKKKIIIIVSILVAVCLAGVGAYAALKSVNPVAEVYPVSYLDESSWISSNYWMEGQVTADATQEVYLTSGQKIKEIYVEEGQQVSIGDELLAYDTSVKSLELDREKTGLEIIDLEIQGAKLALERLRKEKPYTPPPVVDDPIDEEEEEPDDTEEPEDNGEDNSGDGMVQNNDVASVQMPADGLEDEGPVGRTQEEINEDIKEKEKLIKEKELVYKETEFKIRALEEELEGLSVLKSSVNGVVKKIEDPDEWRTEDGRPFLSVSSEEGLYIKGVVNELEQDIYQPGAMLSANAWESNTEFMAEITEISEYPSSYPYVYMKNPNSSNYTFTAHVIDDVDLRNGESVELNLILEEDQSDYVCIDAMYVRQENAQYYVMIGDENNRLKKQYVTVGRKFYGSTYEIISGLSPDDVIAFPYGKTAKEGAGIKNMLDDESDFQEVY